MTRGFFRDLLRWARLPWFDILAWLLAAFFLAGAVGNAFVSEENAANYARWGYPAWLHLVTAVLEFVAAILLVVRPLRIFGALLGGTVMLAAVGAVVLHGEYAHAIPPTVVLGVSVLVAFGTRRGASARRGRVEATGLRGASNGVSAR